MNNRINWLIVGLLLHLYAELAIWLPLVADRHLGLYPWATAIVWCVSALWVLAAMISVAWHTSSVEYDYQQRGWQVEELEIEVRRLQHECEALRCRRETDLEDANKRIEEREKKIVEMRHAQGIYTVNEVRRARGMAEVSPEDKPLPAIPDEDYPCWVSEDEEYGEELEQPSE